MKDLNKIQSELKVPKGNFNSFGKYKYRSCADILEALKPILLKHNATLNITDDVVIVGAKLFIKSTACLKIADESMCVNGFAELSEHKGMSAEQTTGTASSYARKYALNGLFLIDETEADPDSKEMPLPPLSAAQFESCIKGINAGKKVEAEAFLKNYTVNENQRLSIKLAIDNYEQPTGV